MINFHRSSRRTSHEADVASVMNHGQSMRALGRATMNYPDLTGGDTPMQRGFERMKFVAATILATLNEGREAEQKILFLEADAGLNSGEELSGEQISTLADNGVGVVIRPFN